MSESPQTPITGAQVPYDELAVCKRDLDACRAEIRRLRELAGERGLATRGGQMMPTYPPNHLTALRTLLAILHRDGGQHTEQVGLETSWNEACEQASLVVAVKSIENDNRILRAEVERLRRHMPLVPGPTTPEGAPDAPLLDLFSCPLCGAPGCLWAVGDGPKFTAHCVACGVRIERPTLDAAIAAWNRRPTPPPAQGSCGGTELSAPAGAVRRE
jgi:hypothetical protein